MKNDIKPSEITPESTYNNRRFFMKAGFAAGAAVATGSTYRFFNPVADHSAPTEPQVNAPSPTPTVAAKVIDTPNSFDEITHYNNFYEFSTNKGNVARAAEKFITSPWSVEVGGMVGKPRTFDLSDLLKIEQEERIYRLRCVEGWSMVIPWQGFPLKRLLDRVQPLGSAKYVAFQSYYDPAQMPNGKYAGIELPYVEGLRLDEAMHPFTILATGLYGKPMPNQNGAPIRLVVPWKYGFKSIKSIIKITLTDTLPPTTWHIAAPDEYGFYSNVNPSVDHPRWSQATEQRIGEYKRRPSLLFNGYADEVAHLYAGLDLKANF